MKVGDLCRVIEMGTHNPTQYGDHVILLQCCKNWETRKFKMWLVYNYVTGEQYHHWESDLEVVSCK
jgi:hypothetical protein